MRITYRHHYSTCTECEETHMGAFSVTIGTLTMELCRACMKRLAMLITRAERRSEAAKA